MNKKYFLSGKPFQHKKIQSLIFKYEPPLRKGNEFVLGYVWRSVNGSFSDCHGIIMAIGECDATIETHVMGENVAITFKFSEFLMLN